MNLPPYAVFPYLRDDKVALSEIKPSNIDALIEISFYDAVQATTRAQAAEMQDKIMLDYRDGNSIHWGIIDLHTAAIVGTCGYYRGLDKGEGELGCVLLPAFRGQGYMLHAMQLAIEYGRHSMGLKRIWAITTRQNVKAISLLEKLNFIQIADLANDELSFELKQEGQ